MIIPGVFWLIRLRVPRFIILEKRACDYTLSDFVKKILVSQRISRFAIIIRIVARKVIVTSLLILFLFTACSRSVSNSNPSTSKTITNTGSDTIVNLALAWAEQYQKENPGILISVTGGGSGTGINSLLNGTTDIANASRVMKDEEKATAKKNGFTPKEFVIAKDAIAVIVNPENPVKELTLEQVSKIYKCEINNWSELGGEDRPIVRLSRESNSGTHVYFLENVIRLGSKTDKSIFCPKTLLLPSSEGIIAEVRDNPNAIGYDGLGYVTDEVKLIALAKDASTPYVLASEATANDGTYPISRNLYMYTRGEPTGEIAKYIQWILSPEGQKIVANLGFVPIKGN
jgi:phosphate transport system substrate-binding protein